MIAQLWAESGETFHIRAKLHPLWSIDSVELSPEGALDDWRVIGTGSQRVLELRLRTPLCKSQSMEFEVGAHRRLGPGQILDHAHAQIVSLEQGLAAANLYAIRCASAFRLRVQGEADIEPLEFGQLDAVAQSLLDARRGDYIFRSDELQPGLQFSYARGEPQWNADLQVVATLGKSVTDEQFNITCEAAGAPLDRIRVELSPRRTAEVRWTLPSHPEIPLAAQRILPDTATQLPEDEAQQATKDVEIWDISLPDINSSRIVLQGRRSFRWPASGDQPHLDQSGVCTSGCHATQQNDRAVSGACSTVRVQRATASAERSAAPRLARQIYCHFCYDSSLPGPGTDLG